MGELQARCTTLEEEKYEALSKVRESVQVAEEATLHKDQVNAVTLDLSAFCRVCFKWQSRLFDIFDCIF